MPPLHSRLPRLPLRRALAVGAVVALALGLGTGCGREGEAPAPGAPAARADGGPAPSAAEPETSSPVAPAVTVATPPAPLPPRAAFVDEGSCALCHPEPAGAWSGTDHDLAMQPATPETVLGDFADARFQDASTDTLFTRDEQGFALESEGPDGARARFRVPYVFGVDPLQQVLVELPRGRLQAHTVAWDPAEKRWYSLYPDETIDASDELHWTRPPFNWNFSCAECHATDLRRNYDDETSTYATTWSRLDVGCQACHGPAGAHVEWAMGDQEELETPGHGFERPLGGPDSSVEVEACARCHARRAPLGDGFDHRNRLLDDYLPALLTEGLYHADGQILDEVYEYGSFLQSKMHARGLRCSDCHDPHAQKLSRPGNLTCTSCHSPSPSARAHVDLSTLQRKSYDTTEHHRHEPGKPGSKCVDCHMPQRTYMGVDERRDHGFRVPRPDLSAQTGAPDACTACHAEKDAAWAADQIREWFGPKRPTHWGVALAAGRNGRPGAADGLLALAASEEPAIVRATALTELLRYPSERALSAFETGLRDGSGLVRLAALGGLELLPPDERVGAFGPLLGDPLRAVRAEAARLLVGAAPALLAPHEVPWRAALEEYETIQRGLSDRAEAHLNLAQLAADRGERATAERELRTAIRLDPLFVPAYVNLAELARGTKGEAECEAVLREGLRRRPEHPTLLHALGLALVRVQRAEEGLALLASAAELAPEDARFGYVHAVALHDLGRPDEARARLEAVLARHPGDRDARFALAGYRAESGDMEGASRCLAELAAINPHDPGLAQFAPGRGGR